MNSERKGGRSRRVVRAVFILEGSKALCGCCYSSSMASRSQHLSSHCPAAVSDQPSRISHGVGARRECVFRCELLLPARAFQPRRLLHLTGARFISFESHVGSDSALLAGSRPTQSHAHTAVHIPPHHYHRPPHPALGQVPEH